MKKFLLILVVVFNYALVHAQELFVFTEPASNMPKGSLGLRITSTVMKEKLENAYNLHLLPELMWGVNKNLMLHAEGFISNRSKSMSAEGFGVYAKYRFLSNDKVHSHFRMAAYGRVSYNNSDIHQEEIEINGHNSGYETGVVATQLLNKVALSSSAGFEKALDNHNYKFPSQQSSSAIDYTFSVGKLMLPKNYTDYKQTNVNLMTEFLGQTLAGNGKSYLDATASVQLIFNSQARFDVGYRQQLYSSMYRSASNGFLIRFEYLFFNAVK